MVFEKKIKVLLVQGHATQTNTAAFNRNAAVGKMVESVFDYELIAPDKPFSKIKNRIISGVINRCLIVKAARKAIALCDDNTNYVIFLRSIDPFVALMIWLVARPKGIKLALERNEFPSIFIQKTNVVKKLFYQFLVIPWHYQLFDVLFLITDELLQFYGRYAGQYCILQKLPMTVDFSRFENNTLPSPDAPYIFYAGSLSESKDGVESLISAFSKIAKDFPELRLKIAGGTKTGTLEKRLSDTIAEKQLSDRISLLGFVDRNEIPQYLCAARMVVLPRPDSLQARGGFPTKLGEYLAAGRPVIVTRVGEIPKYLSEDEIFFIPPNDFENELVQKMKYILLHEKKALETASMGKMAAKKYFSLEANQNVVKYAFERLFE